MSSVSKIYKRTEVVGRGKFGVVYKGVHRTTGQVVAIKVLNLDTSEDEVKDVQQEIQFLSHLKQVPNVTHYYGSYLNNTKLWIIMDYCAGGSLRTLLKPGNIGEKYIGVIVRELLIALSYIHKQQVIHRDIKAANVLITNEGKVQLCDFGVAAQLSSSSLRRNTMAGTPYWMAPEVIMEGTSYDVKADIWSLGITIYEIATGNPPYCDKEAIRAMQLITKSKPPRLEGKQYSAFLKEIIALCLDENPIERLSADELLKTKFVRNYKNSSTLLLKELISRYLLWREKKSSRESILMNVEDEEDTNEIEVKWDFDSLKSNDYIIENDINVSNLNINDSPSNENEFDFASNNYAYDDADDEFQTGVQRNPYITNNNTFTYNKNTVTYNANIGSTLKEDTSTRKEAPKSLLKLFENTEEDDDQSQHDLSRLSGSEISNDASSYEIPKISSSIGLHNLSSTNTASSTTRVSTPIVEIEIPNMDEIEPQQQQQPQISRPDGAFNRSRANTLLHSQSTSSAPQLQSNQPPQFLSSQAMMSSQSTSQIPQHPNTAAAINPTPPTATTTQQVSYPTTLQRGTPSPKRKNTQMNSPSKVNASPGKMVSMKAIQSSNTNTQSPLLQPLNANNSQTNVTKTSQLKRNHQNLRLQMPTPTSLNFPKVLNSVTTEEPNDENINQFGVNVSSVPVAMTPLTEKPPNTSISSSTATTTTTTTTNPIAASVPKRKPTLSSVNQPPFLNGGQRTNSSVSSGSSNEILNGGGSSFTTGGNSNSSNTPFESKISIASLNISLFMDTESDKDQVNDEISKLLNNFKTVLELMDDSLAVLNE